MWRMERSGRRLRSGGRHSHHTSGPNESLRTACRVQSRVSMMIPLSSPGRTCSGPGRVSYVLPLSRGCTESAGRRTGSFGCDVADAEGFGAARGGAGALQWSGGVGGVGRRHLWYWLKAMSEGAVGGTPLSPLRKWRRGYGDKEAPCGPTFEKEVEADT